MTRTNSCLLPCPSNGGEAHSDSKVGLQWSYDSFFDGIEGQNLHADYFEEIDGLDCPPMDEAYLKMMDVNLFYGIDNCVDLDSKSRKEDIKNKGSRCGKGKPQSVIEPKLQPICKGEELHKAIDLYKESKMQNKVACGKGKDFKKVVHLYSEKEVLKKPAFGIRDYELKLESTKRKLQQDYEQSKRQRKIQVIDVVDLPKAADEKPRSKSVRCTPKRICKSSTVKQRLSQKLKCSGR